MAFEERDQSGSLFKNTRKEKDSHPDYQGKAIINGQPVYVSAWLKEGKNGQFLSLAFKNRQEGALEKAPSARAMEVQGKAMEDEPDADSIPF